MIETHLWPLTITLGSDVCHLQDIRRSMDAWLETEGCDDETRKAIVLATHEAAANAIEHSQTNSELTVRARTDASLIVLEVSDHGQWKHESTRLRPTRPRADDDLPAGGRTGDRRRRPRHHDPDDGAPGR